LLEWKNSANRKPLIVYGIRQAGKTWALKNFGAEHYADTIYISFDNNPTAKSIFEKDFDIPRIISNLSVLTNTKITPDGSLIILDEIQECPRALTSLKYFCEDAPQYNIAATGSLLGVMNFEATGFPVGKADILTLRPMSFCEFLQALGKDNFVSLIENREFENLKIFSQELIDLLKEYFYIGGMPEALKVYAQNKNFDEARKVQSNILDAYYADFAKHIPAREIAKVKLIWDSVPAQLGKENKRFLYSDMKQGGRGREYENALKWLEDSGLIYKINRISLPNIPLAAYLEAAIFKLYMPDIGLLSARTGLLPQDYILDNDKIFNHYKGMIAEQFVLQELSVLQEKMPLYYWANNKNTAEVEFAVQYKGEVIPIEVKAGKNIKSESLKAYRTLFSPKCAVITSLNDFEISGSLIKIPLYMISQLPAIIES
jgi:predicted AAA+ superfamily ATPase